MDGMKYLKWLNLIPLIMFFIVDKLRGTLISRYLLIIIVALGIMNTGLRDRGETRSVPSGKAYNRKNEKERISKEFRDGFVTDSFLLAV